jgi:hypothetical protein
VPTLPNKRMISSRINKRLMFGPPSLIDQVSIREARV